MAYDVCFLLRPKSRTHANPRRAAYGAIDDTKTPDASNCSDEVSGNHLAFRDTVSPSA